MPEGDTIHRIARTLRPLVCGAELTSFEAKHVEVPALTGARIESIEARGKNLVIQFSTGVALCTHLRMHGSWHAYPHGAKWKRPRDRAVVVFTTADWQCVCFDAPVVEVIRTKDLVTHRRLRQLGEDPLSPTFDAQKAAQDLARDPDAPIGVAVMTQSTISGIGNVYKSELLFRLQINPFVPMGSLSLEMRQKLVRETQHWMRHNMSTRSRTLTGSNVAGKRFFVYLREGEPCRVCKSKVQMRRQGEDARSTYYCPRCQNILV